ncbi:MAG: hypothetical protein A2Z88_09860, partial [Omnitrophica WOR_2 bacterium GWA2_47_8]
TLLKESQGFAHISTGDILREEMKKETKLGGQLKKIVQEGKLVSDDIVTELLKKRFKDRKLSEQGFMLDGYPRTKTQAEILDGILKNTKQSIDFVLNMEASLPVIIQRLGGRRVCRKCGAVFHVQNKPPQKEGVCDVCGGELYQRPDDNEATIKTRMEVYTKNTNPVVDYYKKQKKLLNVDANQESILLRDELIKVFDEHEKNNKNKVKR